MQVLTWPVRVMLTRTIALLHDRAQSPARLQLFVRNHARSALPVTVLVQYAHVYKAYIARSAL